MATTDEEIRAAEDLQRDLVKEKSFLDLFGLVFRVKSNTENILFPLFVFVLFFLFDVFKFDGVTKISVATVTASAKDLVGWYYTILGFLIAGYTIFASVTNVKSSMRMAREQEPSSRLSFLKYVHAVFFKTLIIFFLASCFSLFTVFVLRDHGFLGYIVKSFDAAMHYVLSFIDALNISLFVLSVMMLKSFLFNIYTSVMLAVALGVEDEIEEMRKRKNPSND